MLSKNYNNEGVILVRCTAPNNPALLRFYGQRRYTLRPVAFAEG
jgi:hypothetical protein